MMLHEGAELFLGLNRSEDRMRFHSLQHGLECLGKLPFGGSELGFHRLEIITAVQRHTSSLGGNHRSIGMLGLGTLSLNEDIHLLANVNRDLGLIKLVDDLQDTGVDAFGAVTGE